MLLFTLIVFHFYTTPYKNRFESTYQTPNMKHHFVKKQLVETDLNFGMI